MKVERVSLLKNFMIGVGSILCLYPATSTAKLGSLEDEFSNVHKDWKEVGYYLKESMKQEALDVKK
ncbi:hypothetical protein OURE66S_04108 [Oligella ureolytica]